jgi:centrosomal protein CEP104
MLLGYKVSAASSEDSSHPARELQGFHAHSRGWQSSHWCEYPQALVLQFQGRVSVQQVQLLSHQFKIASQVELFIGTLPHGVEPPANGTEGASFVRLGHFSLDSNERSKYQARELKTVYVPQATEGHYLRLVLHKCHVNEHNLHNQVGLLAIRVIGSGPGSVGSIDATRAEPLSSLAVAPPPALGEPERDGLMDGGVVALLQELAVEKQRAVMAEEYDEAKRIKVYIVRVRVGLGLRLGLALALALALALGSGLGSGSGLGLG